MRRLLLLVSAIVLVDTMLFAALTPLLPGYADEFGLSKTEAGMLMASFALGAFLGAVPSGFVAARLGGRRAVVLGLALMALASLGFGFAGDPWTLGLARFVQGLGSTLSWAGGFAWLVAVAPRERRGEMIGSAIGAAVVGALLGPVLGGVAGVVGTRPAFSAVALAGAVLIALSLRTPGVEPEPEPASALGRAFRDRRFLFSLWLMLLPALLFGVLVVLVSLELGAVGWGAAAIGAVFLAATACEAVLAPYLGRVADRRGRLLPVRIALVSSAAVSVLLALATAPVALVPLVIAASLAYGAFYVPATALISDSSERVGLSQGIGFGITNAAWGVGSLVGPAAGGALADAAGDAVPFLVVAAVCAGTLMALTAGLRSAGTRLTRVPEHG